MPLLKFYKGYISEDGFPTLKIHALKKAPVLLHVSTVLLHVSLLLHVSVLLHSVASLLTMAVPILLEEVATLLIMP